MTTLEGIADTTAVQGLKAAEDTAVAILAAIERAYEAAMSQVAYLATNRARLMAPWVVEVPPSVVAAPPVAIVEVPVVEAPVVEVPVVEVPVVEVPVAEMVPEPRNSPLVEALQALQGIEAHADGAPVPEPHDVHAKAEAASASEATVVTAGVPRPRLVDAEWIAGRHADAVTDQIPVQAA